METREHSATAGPDVAPPVLTRIPARMDRLPWSRFHWLVVVALGITWIFDGLEVTLKGAISGVLQEPGTLHFTSAEIGSITSFYLAGAVSGSLIFGYLTDRLGRSLFFFVTLAVYLCGAFLTAFSWNLWSFILFRFITGMGIGGEYAAINSAIDELVPARLRGRIDLIVNGSYWIGAAIGAASTVILLDPAIFPVDVGWRVGFGVGAVLSLFILFLRRHVPESPRWLVIHGRSDEAERIVSGIEGQIEKETGATLEEPEETLAIHPRKSFGFGVIIRGMFTLYPKRSLLGLSLMVSQAFLYNAIFFTYALILTRFYHVPAGKTGLYLLPFALGNFCGPLVLGRFFDTIGRRQMIAGTYTVSALLLALTGYLFTVDLLTPFSQTALWTVIFFFASAAASSAYLTVSEIFPMETRALAIAFFYSLGTGAGGVVAPWLFGTLIGTGSRMAVFYGYLAAVVLMLAAAVIEIRIGVKAERISLEKVAEPLSAKK
ncbi:MFS transporter [Geobacter sp. SVR]|uniref:MFS transporter n=1 Tax=Geobacter sp. SVR TaxID=2495594 RepID=UPI00143EF721|nr:MFS transporter [Geobacter sp. SVR]BCS52505.1 MFS transporter [Geobacter sp. SVR]GCF84058.1 MFS transporter [Geobacter sp. SVR]